MASSAFAIHVDRGIIDRAQHYGKSNSDGDAISFKKPTLNAGRGRLQDSGQPQPLSQGALLSGRSGTSSFSARTKVSATGQPDNRNMDTNLKRKQEILKLVQESLNADPETFSVVPSMGKEPDVEEECRQWILPQKRVDEELDIIDKAADKVYSTRKFRQFVDITNFDMDEE